MADRSRQQSGMMVAIGAGVVMAGGLLYLVFSGGDSGAGGEAAAGTIQRAVLEGVTDSADPEALWLRQSENRFRQAERDNEILKNELQVLRRQLTAQAADKDEIVAEIGESVTKVIADLTRKVDAAEVRAQEAEADGVRLKADITRLNAEVGAVSTLTGESSGGTKLASYSPSAGQGTNEFVTSNNQFGGVQTSAAEPSSSNAALAVQEPEPAVTSVSFDLEGDRNSSKKLTNYLPAGSYAPAVVLSGVDASVGVSSQSDPRPVLLRVTGPAITAAAGGTDGQLVDITGCVITAEAIGDLSSERVFTRLLTMTCSQEAGTVSEFDVAGFVAGQGKAGVRGQVTSREGDLVQSAAIAGALSGFAGVISQVGGTATGDVTSDEQLQGLGTIVGRGLLDAGGKGAGAALDRLSSYYIERAEQYRPVVSLYGGTPVEIVFQKGVQIDG